MNKHFVASIVFIMAVLHSSVLAEQAAYITDSLRLRVYSTPSDSSEVVETLESGDSIELLEQQGDFSQIRTYDGTTGWVKSAFIVEEPPAKLLYYSVSEQNKKLEEQIEILKTQTESLNSTESTKLKELEKDLEEQKLSKQKLQEKLNLLQKDSSNQESLHPKSELQDVQHLGGRFGQSMLAIGLAAVLALLGYLLGVRVSSRKISKRLHGYRFE